MIKHAASGPDERQVPQCRFVNSVGRAEICEKHQDIGTKESGKTR
jgi:hypothetical protein